MDMNAVASCLEAPALNIRAVAKIGVRYLSPSIGCTQNAVDKLFVGLPSSLREVVHRLPFYCDQV